MNANNTTTTTQSTTASRRHLSATEKVALLRLHLLEGRPISALCEEQGIAPSLFYAWQKTFFENGAAAFERTARSGKADPGQQRVAQLEAQLQRKNEVIAVVTEELVRTKKELGED